MDCRDVERLSELSLDGELGREDGSDLQDHLDACDESRTRAHARRHFQSQIKLRLVESGDGLSAPGRLEARICTQLQRERSKSRTVIRWALPATVGAAMIAVLSISVKSEATLDPEEAVARHCSNPPPEVRARGSSREVKRFFQKNLRYPVTIPRLSERHPNVRLVGARLAHLHKKEAAHLMYDHRGGRISVFASRRNRWAPPASFVRRTVGGRSVYVGRHRGYTVVAVPRGTVLYSLVSDVDDEQLVRLASDIAP